MKKKSAIGPGPMESALFAQLAAALPPLELPAQQREHMRQRVMRTVAAGAPAGSTTIRLHGGDWFQLTPLVRCKVLRVDAKAGNQTVMVQAKPGGKLPRHRHGQDEEFIVLEGECRIGNLHLRAGDAHFAPAGSWHEEITTDTGVLVLVRGEYPAPGYA